MKENHLSQRLLSLLALILMTALPGWTGAEAKADNSLFIDPVVGHVGKTVYIPVSLDNTDEVVAAQFDVTLPFAMPNDGVITMSNRQNGHAVSSRISGKTVTVLLSSMENKAIRGNSGFLLRIPMTTYDDGHTDQPYAITIRNIVLTNSKGENIATEKTCESTFTVSKEDCPDLTVEKVSVTTSESSLYPGKNASFSYTVKNSGTGATQAGWSASVYLESEITGVRTLVGSQRHNATMAAGTTETKQFDVILPSVMHIDGEVKAVVELTPATGCGELIVDQGNNTGEAGGYSLGKALYFSSNKTTVSEGAYNGYATITLTRSGDWTLAESFEVTSSVDKLFCTESGNYNMLPATVVIPKGAASVSFRLYSVNDDIVRAREADISVADAHGYEGKTLHVLRTDDDRNALKMELVPASVTEGEPFELIVTRGGELTDELTLNISCSDLTRFGEIPALTFAKGVSAASCIIKTVDDETPQLDKNIRFSVAATDYQTDTAYLQLKDDDRPTLTMTLSPAVVTENAGNSATTATISRTGNNHQPLKVKLLSSSGEVFVGSSVVEIPAGAQSVEVSVGVTDNSLVDGNRSCKLTAMAFIEADNSYAPGSDRAFTTASLTVCDDESPYLALASRAAAIAEGSGVTVTVSRIISTYSGDLVVKLTHTGSGISYPASVTIPSGSSYTSFTVSAEKNTTADDDRYVTLTATSNNITQGAITLRVTDRTLPDATITTVGCAEGELYSGVDHSFSATVQNVGTAPIVKGMKLDFYLCSGSSLTRYTSSTPLFSTTIDQDIEIGGEATIHCSGTVPQLVGNCWLYAVVNADHAVSEFSTGNNTVGKFLPLHIKAPFAVTEITTDKADYLPGEYVQVSGKMEGKLNGQTVRVKLNPADGNSSGQYSYTDTQIDASGLFSARVLVDRSAYGNMQVIATAIGQTEPAKTTTVNVYNMSIYSVGGSSRLDCNENYPVKGSIRIYNRSAKQITGVALQNTTLPFGCALTLGTIPSTINANSYVDVDYTINPTVAMATQKYESFSVKAQCSEGVSVELPFSYLCRATSSNLVINPSPLNTTLLLNSSRTVEVKLTNYGLKESGKIAVNIPSDVQWLTLLAPAELPSLQPGESTSLRLLLTHQEGMHSGRSFASQINVIDENGVARNAKVNITVVGTEYSTLKVTAHDVYTLTNNDKSRVNLTAVTVKNVKGETVFTGFIGNDGTWACDKMTEGSYTVTLRGLRHKAVSQTLSVGPGEDKSLDFILPYQAVLADFVTTHDLETNTYKMKSTILIDDKAPQAIVVPAFGEDDFNQAEGTVDVVIQNVGSRTAVTPRLLFPTSIEGVSMTVTNGFPASLKPGERYVLNIAYTCPTGMSRRVIASMVMNYAFDINGTLLSESDIYQQLVGSIAQPDMEKPEPAPVVDPTVPKDDTDGADSGYGESEYESENLVEPEAPGIGTALHAVGGWATLTFEDITKAKAGQPIKATLKVKNGSENIDMTQIRFLHDAYDNQTDEWLGEEVGCTADAAQATGFFPSTGGTLILNCGQEGELPLTFQTSETIAPDGSREILLGGQLAYSYAGIHTTAAMPYIVITVSPVGKAEIAYLVQRNYMADDVTTESKEETRPAELVMMVRNTGASKLGAITIGNSQPTVLSNNTLAPVNYSGLYSSADGHEGNYDFTNVTTDSIATSTSQIYRWMYAATELAHVDNLTKVAQGTWIDPTAPGADNEVTVGGAYELVRTVCSTHPATAETSDEEADCPADIDYQVKALAQGDAYLVNMIEDENGQPDYVITDDVNDPKPLEVVSGNATLAGTAGTYTLQVMAKTAGWVYGEMHDPTNGVMMLTKVTRNSDGATMAAANFWQTDRTVGADYSVINENLLHFADCIGSTSESYTLTFVARPDDKLKVTAIHLLKADGTEVKDGGTTKKPVVKARIEFNKDVRQVYVQYVNLHARGELMNLGDKIISRNNYKDYEVSFDNVTAVPGEHTFTVITNKLKEKSGGALGEGEASVSWTEDTDTKVWLDIAATPDETYGSVNLESGEYAYGSIELEAQPHDGYMFAYWTIDGIKQAVTDSKLAYEVKGQASIRAHFAPLAYQVTVVAPEHGELAGSASGTYSAQDEVRWVAVPAAGYTVDQWIINGEAYASCYEALWSRVDRNLEVTVTFKPTQTQVVLKMEKGWNWASHGLAQPVSPQNFLQEGVNRLQTQTEELYRDSHLGIVGSMDELSAVEAFKLYTTQPLTITLDGERYPAKTASFTVNQGWNWIGYPLERTLSLQQVLSAVSADEGDCIVGLEEGFSVYTDGQWIGEVHGLSAGKGYLFKSASDKRFRYNTPIEYQLVMSESTETLEKSAAADMPWTVSVHDYPQLMCIIGSLLDELMLAEEYDIVAFVNGECRGVSSRVADRWMLSVRGGNKADELVSFAAWNRQTGELHPISETMVFQADLLGSIAEPLAFHLDFTTSITAPGYSGSASYSIYNLQGHKLDAIHQPGIYILRSAEGNAPGKKTIVSRRKK